MNEDKAIVDQERVSRARIPQLEAEIIALKDEIARRDIRLTEAYSEGARVAARLEVTQAIVTAILRGLEGDTE